MNFLKADNKYAKAYNTMEPGQYYSAAKMTLAPASMTAMVKRGLLIKKDTTPKTYCRVEGAPLVQIANLLDTEKVDTDTFFTVYKKDVAIGMLCSYVAADLKILDCYDKIYDLENVERVEINGKNFEVKNIG